MTEINQNALLELVSAVMATGCMMGLKDKQGIMDMISVDPSRIFGDALKPRALEFIRFRQDLIEDLIVTPVVEPEVKMCGYPGCNKPAERLVTGVSSSAESCTTHISLIQQMMGGFIVSPLPEESA